MISRIVDREARRSFFSRASFLDIGVPPFSSTTIITITGEKMPADSKSLMAFMNLVRRYREDAPLLIRQELSHGKIVDRRYCRAEAISRILYGPVGSAIPFCL